MEPTTKKSGLWAWLCDPTGRKRKQERLNELVPSSYRGWDYYLNKPDIRKSIGYMAEGLSRLETNCASLLEAKNQAYSERTKLIAALSKLLPSWLGHHDPEDKSWDADWRTIIYIDTPNGQCSWHIHREDKWMFGHLECDARRGWDGHSTEEKYLRLRDMECGWEWSNE